MQQSEGNTNDVIQIGVTIAIDFWYNEFRGDVEFGPKILLGILSFLIGLGCVQCSCFALFRVYLKAIELRYGYMCSSILQTNRLRQNSLTVFLYIEI